MLYDIEKGVWDEKLLEILGIPSSILPKICSSSEVYGYIDIMGASVPICGIAGDQQAALFGQCCFGDGEAKNTYGTGCFLLAHTGNQRISSRNGLITTVAATEKGKPSEYALEGSVFVGGAVIQWLRDELKVINESKDSEYFAKKVKDCDGVYLIPAFAGLGAPHWDMKARGNIVGLTSGVGKNHVIRAALESIAYQTEDVISAMNSDMVAIGEEGITSLRVDGGASANDLLMQMQSDISGISVSRASNPEATAAGAAYLAGLAVGFFENREELSRLSGTDKIFTPKIGEEERQRALGGWQRAVRACKIFTEEE